METSIYVTDIRRFPADAEQAALLPPNRAQKMRAFLRPDDRTRCLAGWLLMARFLGERLSERLRHGRYGKPYLPGGPYFNLSHSGCHVVLAVSDVPVGVDVEERSEEDCLPLALTAFHPRELDWFRRAPTAGNFFDLWTLKESYLKLLGAGLSRGSNTFALDRDEQETRLPDRPGVRFRSYGDALPGHSLALCLLNGEAPRAVTPIQLYTPAKGTSCLKIRST